MRIDLRVVMDSSSSVDVRRSSASISSGDFSWTGIASLNILLPFSGAFRALMGFSRFNTLEMSGAAASHARRRVRGVGRTRRVVVERIQTGLENSSCLALLPTFQLLCLPYSVPVSVYLWMRRGKRSLDEWPKRNYLRLYASRYQALNAKQDWGRNKNFKSIRSIY